MTLGPMAAPPPTAKGTCFLCVGGVAVDLASLKSAEHEQLRAYARQIITSLEQTWDESDKDDWTPPGASLLEIAVDFVRARCAASVPCGTCDLCLAAAALAAQSKAIETTRWEETRRARRDHTVQAMGDLMCPKHALFASMLLEEYYRRRTWVDAARTSSTIPAAAAPASGPPRA